MGENEGETGTEDAEASERKIKTEIHNIIQKDFSIIW